MCSSDLTSTKTGAKSGTKSSLKMVGQDDADTDMKCDVKYDAKSGAKSGTKSSSKMVGQNNVETDVKSDTKTPRMHKPKGNNATAKENKQRSTAKDSKHKKGAGSKSGILNRRDVGASDDEIAELDAKTIEDASVVPTKGSWTDEEKYAVVVNQAREYIKVSANPYVSEYGINTHFF